jgi:hypothetical protein
MKVLTLMVVFAAAAAAHAGAATEGITTTPVRLAEARGGFYCQPPGAEQWWAGNAATYYSTEMADDIPNALTGQRISRITFYVSEWECGFWRDPQGLVINFYDQACPPDASPSIHFEVSWGQLDVEIVHDGGPPFWYVRKVTATLPELVTIQPDMSIGGASVNDWSFQEHGWLGLIMTADYDVTGCEFTMDCAFQGIPRWTPGSATPWWQGIPHDLAYCLAFSGPTPTLSATWGRIKELYR